MPRRGENIYKRKDSRWEGRVLQPDGKYRYFYAKAYREVKEKMKTAKEKHLTPKKTITQTQGFAVQQFEGWLAGNMAQQVKPSTYENYYRCMHCYTIPFFSEKGNELLTEHTAKRFVKSIRENGSISESYQKKILTIFKTAVRQILNSSPECLAILSAIQLPKIEETEIQVFSMKEQRKVEAAALHSSDSRALGVILCFYTGIRLGELCALKWGDIDLETGAMSIQRTVARTKKLSGKWR